MSAPDFPASPTVGQTYTAPSGIVYTWDGAVWKTTGAPQTAYWTDTGTALTPTDATKLLSVAGVSGQTATMLLGNRTTKGRWLAVGNSDLSDLSHNFAVSADGATLTQDDATKPSWLMQLNATADSYRVLRAPAGNTAGTVPLLTLDNAGKLTLPGPTAAGADQSQVIFGSLVAKGRVLSLPGTDWAGIAYNQQYNGSAWSRDDASKASAALQVGLQLSWQYTTAAGVTTNNFIIDTAGNLTITGAVATKASGTTWANPSDPRLKDDVTPYPHGLADICQLEPISYTLNGLAGTPAGTKACGFDADAVRAVFPDCVTSTRQKLHPDDADETDVLALDIHGILIALVNAAKELATRLTAVEARDA